MKIKKTTLLMLGMFYFLAACQEKEEPLTLNEGEILNELHQVRFK